MRACVEKDPFDEPFFRTDPNREPPDGLKTIEIKEAASSSLEEGLAIIKALLHSQNPNQISLF